MAAAAASLCGAAILSTQSCRSSSRQVKAASCRHSFSSPRSHVQQVVPDFARSARIGLRGIFQIDCLRINARKEKNGRIIAMGTFAGNRWEGFGVEVGRPGTRRIGFAVQASGTNGREEIVSEGTFLPPADFYKVEAIVRPWRVAHVASALIESGIRGVTVTDVRGFGSQGVSRERHAGSEFTEDSFVTKVKLEVVVSKDQVEVVISRIIEEARTGEIGDGKIFVVPVADVIRVRTGERGLKAERMAGGRADLLSAKIGQAEFD